MGSLFVVGAKPSGRCENCNFNFLIVSFSLSLCLVFVNACLRLLHRSRPTACVREAPQGCVSRVGKPRMFSAGYLSRKMGGRAQGSLYENMPRHRKLLENAPTPTRRVHVAKHPSRTPRSGSARRVRRRLCWAAFMINNLTFFQYLIRPVCH